MSIFNTPSFPAFSRFMDPVANFFAAGLKAQEQSVFQRADGSVTGSDLPPMQSAADYKSEGNDLSVFNRAELIRRISLENLPRADQVAALSNLYAGFEFSKQRHNDWKLQAANVLQGLRKDPQLTSELNYVTDHWKGASLSQITTIAKKLHSLFSTAFGVSPVGVKFEAGDPPPENPKGCPCYDRKIKQLIIYTKTLRDFDSLTSFAVSIYHETWHAYQMKEQAALKVGLQINDARNRDRLMLWAGLLENASIGAEEQWGGYLDNPVEKDAFSAADAFLEANYLQPLLPQLRAKASAPGY